MKVKDIVLFVGVLAISLALAEMLLRNLIDLPLPKPLPQVRYDSHPVRRFSLKPDQQAFTFSATATVDEAGFRQNGESEDSRTLCLTKIFALGDSFTFGMGVADHETWPAQLEVELRTTLPGPVCVINGGTISYGVFQELDLLEEEGLHMKPKVVIHGLYWNDYQSAYAPEPDAQNILTPDGYFKWDTPPTEAALIGTMRSIANRSAILFVAKRSLKALLSSRDSQASQYETEYRNFVSGSVDPRTWQPIKDFYEHLRLLSEKHGFSVYVVVFPVSGLCGDPAAANHPFIRHVRGVLDSVGIRYVDGFELWSKHSFGRPTFLPYNRHLNAFGYEIISKEIANLVSEEF